MHVGEICPECNAPAPPGVNSRQKTCSWECGLRYKERRVDERRRARAEANLAAREPLVERTRPTPHVPEMGATVPISDVKMPAGRPFSDERNRKRIGFSPIRVATFDIETTGLNAAFGRILCACVMTYDPEGIKVFRADEYPAWKAGKRSDDHDITAELMAYLEEFDVLIAHNGVKYDLPFIRTRAIQYGLPPLNPLKIVDPVLAARRQLRMQSNSLDAIAKHLDAPHQKTPLEPRVWARAMMDDDKAAMDLIVEHCIADVKVLDFVAWSMRGYIRSIDTLGSYR